MPNLAQVGDNVSKNSTILTFVREMNVLHPDFVFMPGDLIDGYIRREGPEGAAKDFNEQYDEVASFVKDLEMPLYFVPGNHDVSGGALTGPRRR